MKYIYLSGENIDSDAEKIKKSIAEDVNSVFIYTHKKTELHVYIDELDKYLSESDQFKLRICYERENLNLSYCCAQNPDYQTVSSMSRLVGLLDESGYCRIVVNDDKRSTLAEIVQQLIYISYPLTKVEIMLKKEEKDYKRAERFMQDIDRLDKTLDDALYGLHNITVNASGRAFKESKEALSNVIAVCDEVKENIDKVKSRELKIAIAASKKTGKSVIVNSMIGEELAPTSLEMATPNTCIYTRSADDKYHLEYKGEKLEFDSSEDIYKKIDDEFKKAQEDSKNGFAIPDMNIEYVSSKNNFEAYTIYDTPGPDAAGTTHGEKAKEAMQQCDVAVFAIDYTKYLTRDEEEYLRDIKKLFNDQMKFDSLIFTINKIDARYQDANTCKSVIKSIDFIRSRLKKIDTCYSDCAIFATSALQYFNALEAEKECGDDLRQSTDLYDDLRPLKKKYGKVRAQLGFLDAQVGYMDSESGVQNITLELLKHYSGMPDLLNYVAYIAKTKARNELVNAIAYKIDLEQAKIEGIISRIDNLRKLMDADEEQIHKITEIFHELEKNAEGILNDRITESDIRKLESSDKEEVIKMYQDYMEKKRGSFNFQGVIEMAEKTIEEAFGAETNIEKQNNVYDKFYDSVREEFWKKFQNEKNKKTVLYEDDLFLNPKTIAGIADTIRKKIRDRQKGEAAAGSLKNLSSVCELILNNRAQELQTSIDETKQKLQKLECDYDMPAIPKFDAAMNDMVTWEHADIFAAKVEDVVPKLESIYKKSNIFTRFRENWNNPDMIGKEKREAKDISKKIFEEQLEKNAHKAIQDLAVKDIKMGSLVKKDGKQLAKDVKQNMSGMIEHFNQANKRYMDEIKRFTGMVDDREKYKEDMERLQEEAAFIHEIADHTKAFIGVWKEIVDPLELAEQEAERKE